MAHFFVVVSGSKIHERPAHFFIDIYSRENGVCEQTYYKWQKRLFEMAQFQQEVQFAEVTPVQSVRSGNVAVTVRIAGAEADIHSGADVATVETVLRILKSC